MKSNRPNGRTISDNILLDIYYEGLSNAAGKDLTAWIKKQAQLIAMLDKGGFIKHRGGGYFVLTTKGAKHLQGRYPKVFKRHGVQ